MRQINANDCESILLGRQGENLATRVIFDISEWKAIYGNGTPRLMYRHPSSTTTSEVTATVDGNYVFWDVTSAYTAISSGCGECELLYYSGDTLVKSRTWITFVDDAMDVPESSTPTQLDQSWVDQVLKASSDAQTSASAAAKSASVYDSVASDINHLTQDIAANSKSDAVTKRSLDALWKLNQGISYQFEQDTEEAYEKAVPSGGKYAAVEMIGGHTEAIDGALVSADVESVLYDGTVAGNIPDVVRALSGYGWSSGDAHNSIERTDTGWQYVQRVGSREYQDGDTVTDGVTTYYVFGTPVITDITDLMADFQENFAVEAGGTITFENAAKLTVPNSVEYVVSLAEVGSV